jgi:hypothetical protein
MSIVKPSSASDPSRYYHETTHLERDTRDLILFHCIMLNNVRQRSSLHKLHHHPEIIALDEIRLEEVDNVRVLRLLHDQDLVHDQLLPWLVRQVHLLDRDLLARRECLSDEDLAGGTVNDTSVLCLQNASMDSDTYPCPTFLIFAYNSFGSSGDTTERSLSII